MSFESVYERYFPPLYRYVHRWTGDAEMAEDVVQETFVRYLSSGVPEEEARPWLFRVASNLIRDDRRRRSRRRKLVHRWVWWRHEAGEPDPDLPVEVGRARRALESLADRDRQMLLMREEGFPYQEIAEAVGISRASVGTLLRRALERFRKAYEHE